MKNHNEDAAIHLKSLGYDLPAIRRALVVLAGLSDPELARRCGVIRQTVEAQVSGRRDKNLRLQALIANELGIRPDIIWEGWADLEKKTGAVLRPASDKTSSARECAA